MKVWARDLQRGAQSLRGLSIITSPLSSLLKIFCQQISARRDALSYKHLHASRLTPLDTCSGETDLCSHTKSCLGIQEIRWIACRCIDCLGTVHRPFAQSVSSRVARDKKFRRGGYRAQQTSIQSTSTRYNGTFVARNHLWRYPDILREGIGRKDDDLSPAGPLPGTVNCLMV